MKELNIAAVIENIPAVMGFVDAELERIDCPMKAQFQIDVAIDEVFTNISQYAYAPGTGNATVRVEITDEPREVIVTFLDQGVPFNPLEKEDPDVTLSAAERRIGGLGIFMVKNSMDHMQYEYKDGQNILTVRKRL